jgi:hypothetical protein
MRAMLRQVQYSVRSLRHGVVVNVQASTADGTVERSIAAQILAGRRRRPR